MSAAHIATLVTGRLLREILHGTSYLVEPDMRLCTPCFQAAVDVYLKTMYRGTDLHDLYPELVCNYPECPCKHLV